MPVLPPWATRGTVRSQWIFRTSPEGRHLGYLTPDSGALHLRDRSGGEQIIDDVHGNDWRFSPDGTRVAAVVGEAYLRRIVVLDLASGRLRELGRAILPDRVEWTLAGVVVRERDPRAPAARQQLTYLPLKGPSRALIQRRELHYATATASSRVFVFDVARDGAADVLELSVDEPGPPEPRLRGHVPFVLDADVSPDGRRVAVVSSDGAYLIDDGVRRLSSDADISTLWFSRDGARLLFVSPRAVTLLEQGRARVLAAATQPWKSARFTDDGRQVLIAGARSVLRWDPQSDAQQTLLTARPGEAFVAADLLGDDVIVWTESDRQ